MARHIETTDGKFVYLGNGEWWQTDGVNIVRGSVVYDHMTKNAVGIVVFKGRESV